MRDTAGLWRHAFERVLMCLLSAVLFFFVFHLNTLLLHALEHTQGVNWVFLPAGLRVLLVLVLGLPGAIGILLGTWLLDFNAAGTLSQGLWLNGVISGGIPYLLMNLLIRLRQLPARLRELDRTQIVLFTLLYAALNALGHQIVWSLFQQPGHVLWIDIWPMFVGDALGVILFLQAWRGLFWLKDRLIHA